MKFLFVSNWFTPHQAPLCKAIQKSLQISEFHFLETIPISQDTPVGWLYTGEKPQYVVSREDYLENKASYDQKILDADVVVIGSAPDDFIIERLKQGKLTFKYSERFYKTPFHLKNIFRRMVGAYLHHGRFQKYPLYMLAASAYTASDASVFGNYKNKCYRWGYFPSFVPHEKQDLLASKSQGSTVKLLWAGRMIDWKHPELIVSVAKHLETKKCDFSITVIGDGEMRQMVEGLVKERALDTKVTFVGTKTPEQVREYMDEADIFLFTSDRQEGWGAVLNEAMNSGCAVVADKAIGSVGYLLKHEKNGLIYDDAKQLPLLVERLVDPELRLRLAGAAYTTIETEWNAQVAAERLVDLSKHLMHNARCDLFQSGPCSPDFV